MAGELKGKDKAKSKEGQSVLSNKDKFEHGDAARKVSQMGEKTAKGQHSGKAGSKK